MRWTGLKNKSSLLKAGLIVVPVAVVAAAVAASMFVRVRDSLAQQRAAIGAAWSDVDSALRERAGLIRDLAAIGPSGLRTEAADAWAALHSGAPPQARIQANDRLSAVLAKLLVAEDSRPGAKPSRAFLQLQDEIRDNDERIAVTRLKYNETLEHYNARIQSFPHNLVARIAGFRRNDAYFQTEPF